jgi:hypothetical protein
MTAAVAATFRGGLDMEKAPPIKRGLLLCQGFRWLPHPQHLQLVVRVEQTVSYSRRGINALLALQLSDS